ncbi:malate dehydrogenase [Hibiscus syriacus]|uniref:malate dehydrogenase n=1 Tax=Hibiscus syriacus TaxID=106335 RepID=A0A6A3CB19_HIBSY|nr:malate dehydrogenase [Hibiscus syriacus]
MAKEPVRVLVTGAAGQIGYALVPMIARGIMLGADQPLILHMLDIPPAAEALNGVRMELADAAFPLLKGVVATIDVVEACTGVNVAVMVGGFPRKEGMERKDVMSKNVSIYKSQASALEQHAAPNCKVLVVANPANTNALILKEFAPSIPAKNITCLTRLDHNRALGQISERLNVQVSDVKNVIIWGNHSSTQYPDVNHATVGDKPVRELVKDDEWLNGEFITTVQQRVSYFVSINLCDGIHILSWDLVLVVANPANTNALILKEFAPSIPAKNITCLTRLDHNRALGQISERLNVQVSDVKNVIIWGNHSSTQYPDVNHATVGDKPVRELVKDDEWLNGEFITTVQQRGAAIIKARKLSSALSAASAACDHIRDWSLGTPEGTFVSMGVYSDGSYNVPAGVIYSFPVTCKNGEWTIVQGLAIDEFSRKKLDLTGVELVEEKELAYSCLS